MKSLEKFPVSGSSSSNPSLLEETKIFSVSAPAESLTFRIVISLSCRHKSVPYPRVSFETNDSGELLLQLK